MDNGSQWVRPQNLHYTHFASPSRVSYGVFIVSTMEKRPAEPTLNMIGPEYNLYFAVIIWQRNLTICYIKHKYYSFLVCITLG